MWYIIPNLLESMAAVWPCLIGYQSGARAYSLLTQQRCYSLFSLVAPHDFSESTNGMPLSHQGSRTGPRLIVTLQVLPREPDFFFLFFFSLKQRASEYATGCSSQCHTGAKSNTIALYPLRAAHTLVQFPTLHDPPFRGTSFTRALIRE